MSKSKIGIIGGSGLYHIEGFTRQKWVRVKTPFGPPSDAFLTGILGGVGNLAFFQALVKGGASQAATVVGRRNHLRKDRGAARAGVKVWIGPATRGVRAVSNQILREIDRELVRSLPAFYSQGKRLILQL